MSKAERIASRPSRPVPALPKETHPTSSRRKIRAPCGCVGVLSPNGENSAEIQALEPLCCKFAGRASAQAVALLPRSLERQAKPIYAAQDRASKADLRILG